MSTVPTPVATACASSSSPTGTVPGLGPVAAFTSGAGASASSGELACSVYYTDVYIVDAQQSITTGYILYAASLVFFMQCGFAMLCAGSVRMKNVKVRHG